MNKTKHLYLILLFLIISLQIIPSLSLAKGGGYHSGGQSHNSSRGHSLSLPHLFSHNSNAAIGVKRDARGHIERSSLAREQFMRQTGYPHGRPGYVVDHVVPLKRGGLDSPSNMQWQTKGEAKLKDKWE